MTVAASGTYGHQTQEHATNTTRPSSTITIIGLGFRITGRNDEAQTLRITATTHNVRSPMGFLASSSPLTTFATSRIDEPSNRTASSLAHFEHQTPGTLRSVRTTRPLPDSLVYSRLSGSFNCKLTSRALSLSPDCCLPVMALARAGARHGKQERRTKGAYQRRITPLYAGTRSLEPLPRLPPPSYGIGKSRRTIQHGDGERLAADWLLL